MADIVRFLGIDYGTKKIGLALSDQGGQFAFPYAVIANDPKTLNRIAAICRKEKIGKIILGEPLDLSGRANPLRTRVEKFKHHLSRATGLPIDQEPEWGTTVAAGYVQGQTKTLDASAAALILQHYLDRHHDVA